MLDPHKKGQDAQNFVVAEQGTDGFHFGRPAHTVGRAVPSVLSIWYRLLGDKLLRQTPQQCDSHKALGEMQSES